MNLGFRSVMPNAVIDPFAALPHHASCSGIWDEGSGFRVKGFRVQGKGVYPKWLPHQKSCAHLQIKC